jgi:Cu/Ag efflux pump CusA
MSQKKHEFSISSWAVDNRVTVYIFTILIVITGLIAYVTMPREDFPEIIENKIYISSVFREFGRRCRETHHQTA